MRPRTTRLVSFAVLFPGFHVWGSSRQPGAQLVDVPTNSVTKADWSGQAAFGEQGPDVPNGDAKQLGDFTDWH